MTALFLYTTHLGNFKEDEFMKVFKISKLLKEQQCNNYAMYSSLHLNSGDEKLAIQRQIFNQFKELLNQDYKEDSVQDLFNYSSSEIPAALKNEKTYLSTLYNRLGKYFTDQKFTVVNTNVDYSFDIDGNKYIGKVDKIVKNAEGKFIAINFSKYATTFSAKAKKPENKVENSLELLAIKLGLETIYPGITAEIWYLKAKSETSVKYTDVYEAKKGENIISCQFEEFEISELQSKFLNATNYNYNKACDGCRFNCLCTFSLNELQSVEIEKTVTNKTTPQYTKKQLSVIKHIGGAIRVIAGPGAGKTAVLIAKLVNMLKSGINAKNILFLTFTNKACSEIIERAEKVSSEIPKISTFNSLAYEIIKKHKHLVEARDTKLASKIDRYILIFQALYTANISSLSYAGLYSSFGIIPKLDKAFSYLSETYDELININNFLLSELQEKYSLNENLLTSLPILYPLYIDLFKKRGFINYSDQIKLCNKLFRDYPIIAARYSSLWKYVIVDEVQDVDKHQYEFICTIAKHGNITIVGDDDQSIYKFRRGSNEFMLNFHKDFNCIDVIMNDNFRSTKEILALSNGFIAKNTNRFNKTILSSKTGNKPSIYNAGYEEVVEKIKSLNIPLGNIAVITRNTKELIKLSEILDKESINYVSPKDYLIESAIFNTVRAFCSLYGENGLCNELNVFLLLHNFYGLTMEDIQGKYYDNTLLQCIDSKYSKFLQAELGRAKTFESITDQVAFIVNRYFNITDHPALTAINELIQSREILSLEELADDMNYMVEIEDDTTIDYQSNHNKLNLLTAHSSKGKEFDTCFIINAENFKFAENASIEDIEEERRVFYVALTRAKENLFIYYEKESPIISEVTECNAAIKEVA